MVLGEWRFSPTSEVFRTILSEGTHTPLAVPADAAILAEFLRLMTSLIEGTLVDSYSPSNTLGMLSLNGVDEYLRM